jgi:hypothetical protein
LNKLVIFFKRLIPLFSLKVGNYEVALNRDQLIFWGIDRVCIIEGLCKYSNPRIYRVKTIGNNCRVCWRSTQIIGSGVVNSAQSLAISSTPILFFDQI